MSAISREAAVEVLEKLISARRVWLRAGSARDEIKGIDAAICEMLNLPTAQPEIVRCKDCKHRDAGNGICEGRGWPMQLVPDDGFCDKGERRRE